MKKIFSCAVVCAFLSASIAYAQGLGGLSLAEYGTLFQDVKFNPFVQVGYVHMGANTTLPIRAEVTNPDIGSLEIGTMQLSVQDANFWAGNVGFTVTQSEKYSLFASAGGLLPRQFVAAGLIPVNLDGTGASPTIEFTASGLNTWYVQGGIGLGPILGGVYYNYFAIDFGEPRQGSVPLANQTVGGVLITKTLVPYVGFALPAYGAIATILYSPLAWCNTTFDLRSLANPVTQLQYTWKKPGEFISATLQYNTSVSGPFSFGLWFNYTWLNMRGNARLEFVDASPYLYAERDVTATVTQYVLQGGLTCGITF